LQALQLAYTLLEKRQKELDGTNAFLRREMTEKIERKCNALDAEVLSHQMFVFISKTIQFSFCYLEEWMMRLKEN
jgi:hypothetical protein